MAFRFLYTRSIQSNSEAIEMRVKSVTLVPKLQSRRIVPQHRLTNNFHRNRALPHEFIMKFLASENLSPFMAL